MTIRANVYYTVEEVGDFLRTSPEAVLTLLESGRLHGVRVNEDWRILGAELLELSAQQSESSLVQDWLTCSSRSLKEIWDNDEDAIYDQL